MSIFHRGASCALLALAGLLQAGAANAAASLDFLADASDTTSGWGATAQSFTVGTNETLSAYSFASGGGSQGYKFSVYDWTIGGAALFSTTQTWVSGVNTVNGIDLALQAGHTYLAEVDYLGISSGGVQYTGNVYSGGEAYWGSSGVNGNIDGYYGYSGYDTAFKADFTTASAVPEAGNAALLLAGLGLLGVSARRQRRAR